MIAGAALAIAGALAFLHHGHIIAFLAHVREETDALLGRRFRKRRWNIKPSYVQIYFEDPTVHYEVWVQRKQRAVEVGLHFEGEREDNVRRAEALAERADDVRAHLGPPAEIEQWTRRWTRLHETHPVAGNDWSPKRDLTAPLARKIAKRLALYVEALEPLRKTLG